MIACFPNWKLVYTLVTINDIDAIVDNRYQQYQLNSTFLELKVTIDSYYYWKQLSTIAFNFEKIEKKYL